MKNLLLSTVLISLLATSSFAAMGGDDPLRATLMVEELEYQFSDEKALTWDSYAYVGYDLNKLYIYSEGEYLSDERIAESENQLVFAHAIAPYWDVQLGVGYDKTDESDQTWAVLALSGMAPYFFETRATLLVGDDGNVGLRFETEYEALITQKLILSPALDFTAYTQDNLEMGIGSGLSNLSLGLRLRYEFIREFAPYIGVEWSKNFGTTDDISPLNELYGVAGLRFWF